MGRTYPSISPRMSCCTVRNCCCGCTLKTGVLIIGALYLAGAIIGCLGSASSIVSQLSFSAISDPSKPFDPSNLYDPSHPYATNIARVGLGLWVAFLVGFIGNAIANSLLIHGARTAKPGLIMPGVILTLHLFLLLVELIRKIYFLFLTGAVVSFVSGLVFTLVGCVFAVYFFIVIRSYRKQLQENPSGDSAGKA